MKKIIILCGFALMACQKEKLSPQSVVEANKVQRQHTDLDNYITQEFTKPYGIEIKYRWDSNSSVKGTHLYPPKTEKVQEVLETIKHLWLEFYTLNNVGGVDFFKGKNPLRIHLFGGANLDNNGVELVGSNTASAIEMYLYNVNDFDSKDYAKVFILMRSVHHQFAKRLMELYPYEQDKFLTISQKKYLGNTADLSKKYEKGTYIRSLSECNKDGLGNFIYIIENQSDYTDALRGFFSTGRFLKVKRVDTDYCQIVNNNSTQATEAVGTHREGFFTIHSRISASDEVAEIISATLTHTKAEINEAIKIAQTVESDIHTAQEAKEAYEQLTEKQRFVYDYFKKEIGMNLERMQTISIQRIKAYVNR